MQAKRILRGIKNRTLKYIAKTQKKSQQELEFAKKKYGADPVLYDKFNMYIVPENEREGTYRRRLKSYNQRNYNIGEIVEMSSISEKNIKKQIKIAEKKYGLPFGLFNKGEFWKVPEQEKAEVARRLLQERNEQRKVDELNREAANNRKHFVLSELEQKHIKNKSGIPETVQIAATIIGEKNISDSNEKKMTFEEIQEILGDKLLPNDEYHKKLFTSFRKAFSKNIVMKEEKRNREIYFVDWLLFACDYGFNETDYFKFEFYDKSIEDRNTFMGEGYRGYIRDVCNTNIGLFKNKIKFNEYFSKLIRRDWMKVTPDSFGEFKSFVEKHPRFFSKPLAGGGGVGAKVLSLEESTVEELFEYCRENGCIVEELVQQHPKMNEVYDGAINTIRVLTLMDEDNNPLVLGAVAKFGANGMVVDNLTLGGIGGFVIDVETGVIKTCGADKNGKKYYKHPNSGVELIGFQIPEWDKVIDIAKKGAIVANAYNRHVGWDIAIRSDGEIEIIEGNSWPGLSLIQLGDSTGRRYIYEDLIKGWARRMNMPDYPTIPDNVVSVSTPEAKVELNTKMKKYGVRKAL